ncbi:MAG: hypothetical protein ACFFDV_03260 [Candidatus Thorarchaeota archaeon]
MVDTPNLFDKFQEIMNSEPAQVIYVEEQESASVLYKTSWVRILVVRSPEDSKSITIDVEVSPPYPSLSPTSTSLVTSEQTSNETQKLLGQMIEYIQYVLVLESSGFSIDFVGNECLILASRQFSEMPSAEIFEILLPPSAKKSE